MGRWYLGRVKGCCRLCRCRCGSLRAGRLAMAGELSRIYIADQVGAIRFLMENAQAAGAYNLVAPQVSSSEQFVRGLAKALRRPYWFPRSAFCCARPWGRRVPLSWRGLVAHPKRLIELGDRFQFEGLGEVLADLFRALGF